MWIETYTGKRFYPLDPDPSSVDIEDIAHALSNLCRFTGHCREFYSVATHSILCADQAMVDGGHWYRMRRLALLLLLHDAAEAYCSDVAYPIKPHLTGYAEIEERIMQAIYKRLGVDPPSRGELACIKHIDHRMGATEASQLMRFKDWEQWQDLEPYDIDVSKDLGMPTKDYFLYMYYALREDSK